MMNAFEAVKRAVPVEDYAQTLTELKPDGMRLRDHCPIPRHNDRSPSFNIWTQSGSWYCFGACARGGDVIDLCQAVEGGEPWEAMMTLAKRYDVSLPERPKTWFRWQDEKGHRRKMLVDVVATSYQRRLFRCFKEGLESIGDPQEREEEARKLWESLFKLAWLCAQWRVNR
jgi:DNA primase